MTALFPNVPDVPGVPTVRRAPAAIQSAIRGSSSSATLARTASSQIAAGDIVAAEISLVGSKASAAEASSEISPVFSADAFPMGSLYSATGSAQSALTSLANGDLEQAILQAEITAGYAEDTILFLEDVLTPRALPIATTSDSFVAENTASQWGVFRQDGAPLADIDNVEALEFMLEAVISDYPIEQGGFASYNKVIRPFESRVSLTKGGTVESRAAFIESVNEAWQSVDLFNIVTPECVYLDVNVTGVRRAIHAESGVGLTKLDVAFTKVRQSARLAFIDVLNPASSGQANDGSVQTQRDFTYTGTIN